jgi:DNA polymerase I
VLAHVSGDPALIRAFSAGKDIHTTTAAEIFGVKEEEVTSDMRRFAKTINFGIVYGMSAFGLSQQLGIPQDEAKKYIYGYFEKYSGVRKWTEEIMGSARKRGYVSTLLNRIRYLPEINSKNPQMRSFAERLAVNTPIQGTSADIIKIAMIEVRRRLPGSFGCAMILQIHDDLLFECPRKSSTEAAFVIKGIMENAVKLNVPLVVDTRTGVNWRDME